ncbi:hypothetical protein DMB66_03875 [Actinoplanes sp. ATCC 53533]|uniref:hypothetical protein n=1 Tax=Actinoplanes sp. ATCC 53533 TaxID=1288362 RepID=UPI000F7A83A7|nr:hypothetical protein [Actinoplanes sp. ATCC 53533]RSM73174.1 hypothetical protein DMB66_03875 [Actinoplanes sp. ATCC 53533]
MQDDLLGYLLFHPSLAERPDLAFTLAGGFAAVGVLALLGRILRMPVRLRSWPCFAAALLWSLYALWEAELQGKGYNIRADLLLIHPFLTIMSILAVAVVAWPLRRRADGDAVVTVSGPSDSP